MRPEKIRTKTGQSILNNVELLRDPADATCLLSIRSEVRALSGSPFKTLGYIGFFSNSFLSVSLFNRCQSLLTRADFVQLLSGQFAQNSDTPRLARHSRLYLASGLLARKKILRAAGPWSAAGNEARVHTQLGGDTVGNDPVPPARRFLHRFIQKTPSPGRPRVEPRGPALRDRRRRGMADLFAAPDCREGDRPRLVLWAFSRSERSTRWGDTMARVSIEQKAIELSKKIARELNWEPQMVLGSLGYMWGASQAAEMVRGTQEDIFEWMLITKTKHRDPKLIQLLVDYEILFIDDEAQNHYVLNGNEKHIASIRASKNASRENGKKGGRPIGSGKKQPPETPQETHAGSSEKPTQVSENNPADNLSAMQCSALLPSSKKQKKQSVNIPQATLGVGDNSGDRVDKLSKLEVSESWTDQVRRFLKGREAPQTT